MRESEKDRLVMKGGSEHERESVYVCAFRDRKLTAKMKDYCNYALEFLN